MKIIKLMENVKNFLKMVYKTPVFGVKYAKYRSFGNSKPFYGDGQKTDSIVHRSDSGDASR